MDHQFTAKVQAWLALPVAERDFDLGAKYLLQLSGNRVMYQNLMARHNAASMEMIEYKLQKYVDYRVTVQTHEQVVDMEKQVEKINEKRHLEKTGADEAADFKKGKRTDHDLLPDEIQALYVENLSLLQRMREVHLKLRSLSVANAVCPDSERYPFLQELLKLDKQLHHNWDVYDHYTPGTVVPDVIGDSSEKNAQ